jgi:ornithine carbamoyltransferase
MTKAILSKNFIQSQRMAPPVGKSPLLKVLHEDQLRGRDILGIADLSAKELNLILEVAALLKANKFDDTQTLFGRGQTLAMLFEKPSLRTRVTFEAGMIQLGGSAINLEGKLGERESIPDIARNLDRWLDGIMARVFDHKSLVQLADNAKIPVISGLCDIEHPCQALADFLTLQEHKGEVQGLTIAYIGDGNNVANSLALAAAKLGCNFIVACPTSYEPLKELWEKALQEAKITGAKLTIVNDPVEAVKGADAVYTDTWVSMGMEAESAVREKIFAPYQVNAALLKHAKPDAIVMHCLPAHRGYEITDEVIDGPQSVVFDEAENRLHVQKAILSLVL